MNKFLFFILFLIFSAFESFSQVSKPDTIYALKTSEEIILDGKPDEAVWQKTQIVSNFTQRELNNGEPVTEKTLAGLVYDDNALYLGIWCFDKEPEKIIAKEMKRDFPYWTEDNFEIIIDPFNNDRDGYVFVVNPNGARADVLTGEDGREFNIDWNGVWDAEAVITEEGWFAELRIPFSTLKFPDKPIQEWGINLERNIRRKQEQVFWQGWSRNWDFEYVSHAGTLKGLKNIRGNNNLEIKPYITAGGTFEPGAKPDERFNIGGDINYLITPTLKLNLTANTDFAQVESDRGVVNLTRFNIFFPELREFFLEGKDFFKSDIQTGNSMLFYSRRIGIGPDREEIPIIAGARLMGTAGRTNIGAMSIQTAAKGDVSSANNSVVRIEQNILKKTSIGMIFTSKLSDESYNYVTGADLNYLTSDFLGKNDLQVKGSIASSFTKGVDDDRNLAYRATVSYPNDLIEFFAGTFSVQKNFNPELGFLRRDNYQAYSSAFRLKPRPTKWIPWIQQLNFQIWDFDAYYTYGTSNLESFNNQFRFLDIDFTGGERLEFKINRNFEGPDEDFQLVEGIIVDSGDYWNTTYEMEFGTYAGRLFSINASYYFGGFYDGKINQFSGSFRWNLNRHINLSGDYRRNIGSMIDGDFVTDEIGGRFEYAFNPKLYSNLYAQYNTGDEEILLNFRVNWIPVVGSDFYLAINQHISTENNTYVLKDTTILAKFVWRFAML